MPPLQTLVTAFSGLAIGAIICALIVIRGIGWRSVVGTFLICAIGFLGSCVGTLVRSNANTVAMMDFAVRLNQISTIVMAGATHELYRAVTGTPKTLAHRFVLGLVIAFAAYAALSPGGIMYQRVVAVQTEVSTLGGTVRVPAGEIEWTAPAGVAVAILIGLRLAVMSVRRTRHIELGDRLLLVAAACH